MSSRMIVLNNQKLQQLDLPKDCDQNITEIHACFNFIPQISNLPCFSLLTVLSLSCNNLTDIPSLHGEGTNATHPIKELYLANNKITRLRGLEQYPYLQVLDLRSNKISVLENIGRKNQLKRLSLSCNGIREVNFENLSILPKLEFLGLFDNMIDTSFPLTPLLSLTPVLCHLYVGCNPLSEGRVMSLSCLILELSHQHINITRWIDYKRVFLQGVVNHELLLLVKNIVSICPSIQTIDGDLICDIILN